MQEGESLNEGMLNSQNVAFNPRRSPVNTATYSPTANQGWDGQHHKHSVRRQNPVVDSQALGQLTDLLNANLAQTQQQEERKEDQRKKQKEEKDVPLYKYKNQKGGGQQMQISTAYETEVGSPKLCATLA